MPTGPGDEARDGWANWEGNTGYEREVSYDAMIGDDDGNERLELSLG